MGRQRLAGNLNRKKIKRITHHCDECGRRWRTRADQFQYKKCGVSRCNASQEEKDFFMIRKVEERLRG